MIKKISLLLEELKKNNSDTTAPDTTPVPFGLFGIECEAGWYPLLIPILEYIVKYNLEHEGSEISITQIKEKYGELRVYVDHGTPELFDMIDDATDKSLEICEVCGRPGELRDIRGWLYTRCDECAKKLL